MAPFRIEPYPYGKTFAVSMIDDTDGATLAELAPVYACLHEHGLSSTKTVWPLPAVAPTGWRQAIDDRSATLAEAPYRRFCQQLQAQGFEIAMHTASAGNNTRERTLEAYRIFEAVFGQPPLTNVMHGRNKENIYWGHAAVTHPGLARLAQFFEPQEFFGHRVESTYYWGDICREKTRYVRLFETRAANTLAFDPATPYHDPRKPDVPWWFSASYGAGTCLFDLLAPARIERLRRERGGCIIHFYARHYALFHSLSHPGPGAAVHPQFEALVRCLGACPDGWYVPVVTLLDRLRAGRGLAVETQAQSITIHNRSGLSIPDLALRTPEGAGVWDAQGQELTRTRNAHGQVALGTLAASATLHLTTRLKNRATPVVIAPLPREPNEFKLTAGTIQRIAWQYWRGRRGRGNRDHRPEPIWIRELQTGSSR
jgi:hypothetical protein